MKRTFIYTDDKSNKFWSIEVTGNSYTVNYGKVGTVGQTQEKSFDDEAACIKAVEKLIAEKIKKGYVEQGDAPARQSTSETAKPTTAGKKSPAKKAESKTPVITEYYRYDKEQAKAFLRAIRNGKLDLVKQYLAAGAKPAHRIEAKKYHEVVPIIEALTHKRYDVLKELIAHSESYPTGIGREPKEISVLTYIAVFDEEFDDDCVQLINTLIENGYEIAKDSNSILTYYSKMKLPDEMLKMLLGKVSLENDKGNYLYVNIEEGWRDNLHDKHIDVEKRVMDLIDLGVQINPSAETDKYLVKDHGSPVHTALTFYGSSYKLIKKMIDAGADLTIRNTKQIVVMGDATRNTPQNYTPLQLAQSGTIEVSAEVLELLKQHSPADPNDELLKEGSPEKKLITLSMISPQEKDNTKEIRELINKGVDVNVADYKGKTALHHLMVHDWYNIVLGLLPDFVKAGADVNARDKKGRTPLFYLQTSMRGVEQLYKTLIANEADINARDNDGYTPAMYAVSQIEDRSLILDILRVHLACGANPNITTSDGNTLLHQYMTYFDDDFEFDEFIEYIKKKGADLNAKNNRGETPLHIAVARNSRYADDIVEELISAGADINAQDNEGNTALHLAVQEDTVENILKGLPDISIKNNAGVSAMDSVKAKKFDSSSIDSALNELSKLPAAKIENPELAWTGHTIDINADAPEQPRIVSSMFIPENKRGNFLFYAGDNLIAVGGDGKHGIEKITMVDVLAGQIVWEKDWYDGYCNDCLPLIDGDILYMPYRKHGNSALLACNRRTGEELWMCKTGNSYGQYSKWISQNDKYVFNINRDTKKIYFIDKAKGKMKAVKLAHPVKEDSKSDVTSWNDRVITIGCDKKKDRWVLDAYNPATAEFIETFGELGDYSPIGYHTDGKYMYVLTSNARMVKVNLETGLTESEVEIIPGYEEKEAYMRGYNDTLELRKDGKLHFEVLLSDMPERYCTYDISTGDLRVIEMDKIDNNNTLFTNNDIYVGYNNGLVSNSVILFHGIYGKSIAECPMPNYGNNSRIIKAKIVGDAVYTLQQGGNQHGEDNSILYRLQ